MYQVIAGGRGCDRGHGRGCGGEEEVEEGRAAVMVSGIRNSVSTRRKKQINKTNEGPHPKSLKREAAKCELQGGTAYRWSNDAYI